MKKRQLTPRTPKVPRKRGGQLGNRNAIKHGKYARELLALKAEIRAYIRETHAFLAECTPHLFKQARWVVPKITVR